MQVYMWFDDILNEQCSSCCPGLLVMIKEDEVVYLESDIELLLHGTISILLNKSVNINF